MSEEEIIPQTQQEDGEQKPHAQKRSSGLGLGTGDDDGDEDPSSDKKEEAQGTQEEPGAHADEEEDEIMTAWAEQEKKRIEDEKEEAHLRRLSSRKKVSTRRAVESIVEREERKEIKSSRNNRPPSSPLGPADEGQDIRVIDMYDSDGQDTRTNGIFEVHDEDSNHPVLSNLVSTLLCTQSFDSLPPNIQPFFQQSLYEQVMAPWYSKFQRWSNNDIGDQEMDDAWRSFLFYPTAMLYKPKKKAMAKVKKRLTSSSLEQELTRRDLERLEPPLRPDEPDRENKSHHCIPDAQSEEEEITPLQRKAKKISHHVREGYQYRAAKICGNMKLGPQNEYADIDDMETRDVIAKKLLVSNKKDPYPSPPPFVNTLEWKQANQAIVRQAQRGNARDLFGWSAKLLLYVSKHEPSQPALLAMINAIANANVPPATTKLLTYMKGAAFWYPKPSAPNKRSIRPYSWRSLLVVITLSTIRITHGKLQHGLSQFASSLEGGPEAAALSINAIINAPAAGGDRSCLISLDDWNAFGSRDRRTMISMAYENPDMHPYGPLINMLYATDTECFYPSKNGDRAYRVTYNEGVAQGCSLSMDLYCNSIAPLIDLATEGIDNVICIAQADNIFFVGHNPTGVATAAQRYLDNAQEDQRITVDAILWPHRELPGDQDEIIKFALMYPNDKHFVGYMRALGTVIGNMYDEEWQEEMKNALVEKILEKTKRVKQCLTSSYMPLQAAYHTLRMSVPALLVYLLRSTLPEITTKAARVFEEEVQEITRHVAAIHVPLQPTDEDQKMKSRLETLASLPIGMGGLGIHNSTTTATFAFASALCQYTPTIEAVLRRATPYLTNEITTTHPMYATAIKQMAPLSNFVLHEQKCPPTVHPNTNPIPLEWTDIIPDLKEDVQGDDEEAHDADLQLRLFLRVWYHYGLDGPYRTKFNDLSPANKNNAKIQKCLNTARSWALYYLLEEGAFDRPEPAKACIDQAVLRNSRIPGTSIPLTCPPMSEHFKLTDSAFALYLQRRTGMINYAHETSLLRVLPNLLTCPKCNHKMTDPETLERHSDRCCRAKGTAVATIYPHDSITYLLANEARAICLSHEVEPREFGGHRTDFNVWRSIGCTSTDVQIVNNLSSSAAKVNKKNPKAYIKSCESKKKKKHEADVAALGNQFTPLVLSSHGGFGSCALRFIDTMAEHATTFLPSVYQTAGSYSRYLQCRIAFHIQKWNNVRWRVFLRKSNARLPPQEFHALYNDTGD